MSSRLLERLMRPFKDSIRGQILSILMAMLLFGALVLALVFYIAAMRNAKGQMQNSYEATAGMIAGLSAYDFQFNKAGLKDTVDTLIESDENVLWAEFVDKGGMVLQQGGRSLTKAPYDIVGSLPEETATTPIDTPEGKGFLIRSPIIVETTQAEDFGEFGFSPATEEAESALTVLGELRLVVGLKPLAELQKNYLISGSVTVFLTFLVGLVVALTLTKYLVAPIGRLMGYAKTIAEGDLTGSEERSTREDELGRLHQSFQAMSSNLGAMIFRIRTAFQAVQKDTDTVGRVLEDNLDRNREQMTHTDQVVDRISSIQGAVEEVVHLMEGLSQLAEEVSSSVLEMVTSIEEIASIAEGLTESVNTSASTLTQSVSSTREIEASAMKLNQFVEETSAAMTEMESTIRQVESNAIETKKATEAVQDAATSGTEAVEHSETVIKQLQESFTATVSAMKTLGQRSEEVGNILEVIDEVMDQTHLLALNAAIIAAQAGEHGKSFAVVAGEIRALAEKTSHSTREISTIIDSVQNEVQRSVSAVSSQSQLVEQSVAVTRETRTALNRIQDSVDPSLSMVQEIARATGEQARGAVSIVKSTETLRDLSHQLQTATTEQRGGSEQILTEVDKIRSLAEEVKRATQEQSTGSTMIRQAMEKLTQAVGQVLQQTHTQRKASQDVERVIKDFSSAGESNMGSLQDAADQVGGLTRRAEEVAREMARFRTKEG